MRCWCSRKGGVSIRVIVCENKIEANLSIKTRNFSFHSPVSPFSGLKANSAHPAITSTKTRLPALRSKSPPVMLSSPQSNSSNLPTTSLNNSTSFLSRTSSTLFFPRPVTSPGNAALLVRRSIGIPTPRVNDGYIPSSTTRSSRHTTTLTSAGLTNCGPICSVLVRARASESRSERRPRAWVTTAAAVDFSSSDNGGGVESVWESCWRRDWPRGFDLAIGSEVVKQVI